MYDDEAFDKAHRRHFRQHGDAAIIPSQGGEIIEFDGRRFAVLTNCNGLVNAFEIRGERLLDLSDEDLFEAQRRFERLREPRMSRRRRRAAA